MIFPNNVFVTGNRKRNDGTVIKDVLRPDAVGVVAAYHESILARMAQIDVLTARIEDLDGKNLRARSRVIRLWLL